MIVQARRLAFDMDGTLIDSAPMTDMIWSAWATRLGLNPVEVVGWARGRSLGQVVTHFLPFADLTAEARGLAQATQIYEDALRPIAGAARLLSQLATSEWALVTSADPALARRWMGICDLPTPDVVVTAADVAHTKPDPEPYLRAASLMMTPITAIIAFEDSVAGLASARTAGLDTIGIGGAQGTLAGWADFEGVVRRDGDGIVLSRGPDASRA